MKAAIYCHSIAPSIDGVCRRFTGLLKELSEQGHDLMLFTLEDAPEDLPPKLTNWVTLEHMCVPSYPDKKVAKPTVASMMKIWRALKDYKPDVVHVTADGFSHMFALVCLLLGIPIVGSFHTDLMDLLATHNANAFQSFIVGLKERTDSYVLNSCATTSISFSAKLKRQGITCDHVIITAVDTNTFSSKKRNSKLRSEMIFGDTSPGAFLCVYVGRISKEKRLDVIVEAVKNIPGAYLAIIGDGPSASMYAATHGKESRIYCKPRFLSHLELAEIYASSDLHVSASQFETLGNTVLEAFACGIPVVVPRCQGFCDTVLDNMDGFLFEPGNSSSAQGFIEVLKNDPEKRLAMGEHGRKVVSSHTVGHVVKDLIAWYKRGIEKQRGDSFTDTFFVFCALLATVPIAIIALWCYERLMDLLLAVCGYSPVENHPTAHTPPHAVPVPVLLASQVITSEMPSTERNTNTTASASISGSNMSIVKEKEEEEEIVNTIEEILDPVIPESSELLSEVEGKLRRRKKVGVETTEDCPAESVNINTVIAEGQ